MEAARLNLRECSLRSGPCHDEYSGSPTLSAGAVPAAPRSHGPSASRRSANCIKEYGEMFMTHIKIECNGEDPATIPTLGTARSHLQENPMSGNTLWVKEEGFEMKTEDNVHETIITEELDIGPTVLQPRIMPHSVPSSDQTSPEPRPSTSCDDAGPPPLCTVFARPSPQTKVEDEHCESPEGPCNPTSALNVKCTEKADQRALKERAHDHSDSEHTTIDTQEEDQLGYCVEPSTECDCRTEGSKAKAGAYKGDKQYECEYWKYNTTRKSNLISHIGTHEDKESDKYEQSEDSTFGPNYFKTKISAQADQEKPYKCELCDYSGSRVGYLQVHMRTHTGEKPFKCKHCEYSAHRMGSLQSHMRTHSGEKPYKCKQCKYSACKLGELKIHMHTHTAVKPFKCEWCEYSTRKSADLKTHLLTHTGKKPYKCELCEYSASRMGHILIHMRIHTGEKPYKCDQCDYSAYCVSHLRVHLRTHTGEKPYKCELCEYSTSYVSGLKRHMYLHTIN